MTNPFDLGDDLTRPLGMRTGSDSNDETGPHRVDPDAIGGIPAPGEEIDELTAYGGPAAALQAMATTAMHPVQVAANLYVATAKGVQKFAGNAARHIISGTGDALLGGGDDSSDPDEGGENEGEGGDSGGGESGGSESGGGESGGGEANSGAGGSTGGWTPGGEIAPQLPHEFSEELVITEADEVGTDLFDNDTSLDD